ncbi:hypothetical protein J3459_006189 [Metarhizium acridum]|uniref:uncharacterized protein n=1 Tax=Metarhizium acridum TaxID=92637 RepID=UPI001C6ACC43|nr:hypothetical protein J3458_005623 [Metarhizium acridum]KAG8427998.1 hypothetical protein J3459_006189 [Metarhizium acridum]
MVIVINQVLLMPTRVKVSLLAPRGLPTLHSETAEHSIYHTATTCLKRQDSGTPPTQPRPWTSYVHQEEDTEKASHKAAVTPQHCEPPSKQSPNMRQAPR